MASNIKQITVDDGSTKPWRALGARYEEVLATYPPKDGWGVPVTSEIMPIRFTKGSAQLVTIKFVATLVSPSGAVIAVGSTLHPIDGLNAWACGEARARHRLCVALGYGGEILDFDETVLNEAIDAEKSKAKETPAPTIAPTEPQVTAEPQAIAAVPVPTTTTTAQQQDPPTPASETIPVKRAANAPSPLLIKQIEDRARMLGVTPGDCSTDARAKAVWKGLLATTSGR